MTHLIPVDAQQLTVLLAFDNNEARRALDRDDDAAYWRHFRRAETLAKLLPDAPLETQIEALA